MDTNMAISTVVNTIRNEFPELKVYKEKVSQNMSLPSFYVYAVNSDYGRLLGKKYCSDISIAVKYFMDIEAASNCALYEVAARLIKRLELMEYAGHIVRGRNIEYRVEDDILHIYFTLRTKELRHIEEAVMNILEVNEYGKKRTN